MKGFPRTTCAFGQKLETEAFQALPQQIESGNG
jgi:hypothetical protein